MTPEVLKRLIPDMVAAYESPEVRRQIEEAAAADDRLKVMQTAMRAQAEVLMRHGIDPATGLRAIAEAARTHRDDPEIVELSNQLRWRLTALYNDALAAKRKQGAGRTKNKTHDVPIEKDGRFGNAAPNRRPDPSS